MRYTGKKFKKSYRRFSGLVALLLGVVLLLGVGLWLHFRQTATTQVQTNGGTITANPHVPGKTGNPSTNSNNSKGSSGNQSNNTPGTSVTPAQPTGQFVSSHHASLSGPQGANLETSTCITTPGVQCRIDFIQGTTIKSLPVKTADANGSCVWINWSLQSIGLTRGSWTVKAVAINGAKTAIAEDATPLVVAQ